MQNSFSTFLNKPLSPGFKYPESYLEFSKGMGFPENLAWWFDDAESEGGELSWKLRSTYREWKNIGERNLIPFAQLNDAAAFFDGDDLSGNPQVIVIDLGNKNHTYTVDDFDTWLAEAINN